MKQKKNLTNHECIKRLEPFFFRYLYTLKELAQTTREFLRSGTPKLKTIIQIFRIQLGAMKEEISKEPLDPESLTTISAFFKKYPFDDPVQLMINMDARFFICEFRAKHLLKVVRPEELSKVACLLKSVLQTVYWFDRGEPRIWNEDEQKCLKERRDKQKHFKETWEQGEQQRLKASYAPLQDFLKERFAVLEDLLFEHKIPTLFQRRITTILKKAVEPITVKEGYSRYQVCLKKLQDFDFNQSIVFITKKKYLKLLRKAGILGRNRKLVLQFGEDIYNRCKTALQKEGLFERADKFNLLPGISFSDI